MSMNRHLLTEENYFSPESDFMYMGASQFKALHNCEYDGLVKALHIGPEEEKSKDLLMGSYVDAHFSGTLGLFKAQNPGIFNSKTGEIKSDYIKCGDAISRVERDKFMMYLLSGEKQVIMVGEIGGVKYKIKMDSYLPGAFIADMKYMRDFKGIWQDGAKVHWIDAWGYHTSMAIYQEICRQNTGVRLPVYITAVTKEPVPDIGAFSIAQNVLDTRLDLVRRYSPQYAALKEKARGMTLEQVSAMSIYRCETCDNCKLTKVLEEPIDYELIMI